MPVDDDLHKMENLKLNETKYTESHYSPTFS